GGDFGRTAARFPARKRSPNGPSEVPLLSQRRRSHASRDGACSPRLQSGQRERAKQVYVSAARTRDQLLVGTPRPTCPRMTTAMASLLARGSSPCAAFPDPDTAPVA